MPKRDEDEKLLRFAEGHLNQRMENGKLKKRWVLFLGNPDDGHFQLKIYKTKKEKHTVEIQVVSKATYIGTEKGGIYSNKKNDIQTMYWAIILKRTTIIFQNLPEKDVKKDDEITPIDEWYDAMKKRFSMENWAVNPLRGVSGQTDGAAVSLTLYLTQHRVGLAMTIPPLKCCDYWDLVNVKDCKAHGNVLFLYIEDPSKQDLGALAYLEVQLRMPATGDAKRAKDVIDRLAAKSGSKSGRRNSSLSDQVSLQPPQTSERYQPSPTAPRRSSTQAEYMSESPGENDYGFGRAPDLGRGPLPPVPGKRVEETAYEANCNPYANPYDTATDPTETEYVKANCNPYANPYDTATDPPPPPPPRYIDDEPPNYMSTCDDNNGYLIATPKTINHYNTCIFNT
ncbi:uncharacterized protein [Amphiura filiformis]|uniref:uncharacterized protein n=1 Tax=Amphiura filiformis TaxID=82378 RepID=UPI003B224A12